MIYTFYTIKQFLLCAYSSIDAKKLKIYTLVNQFYITIPKEWRYGCSGKAK